MPKTDWREKLRAKDDEPETPKKPKDDETKGGKKDKGGKKKDKSGKDKSEKKPAERRSERESEKPAEKPFDDKRFEKELSDLRREIRDLAGSVGEGMDEMFDRLDDVVANKSDASEDLLRLMLMSEEDRKGVLTNAATIVTAEEDTGKKNEWADKLRRHIH